MLEVIGDPDIDPQGADRWKSYALEYLVGWRREESVPGHRVELDDDDVAGLRLAFPARVASCRRGWSAPRQTGESGFG